MRRPGQHGAAAPELMPQEQACCAFLTFGTRPGTLTITAPEEARGAASASVSVKRAEAVLHAAGAEPSFGSSQPTGRVSPSGSWVSASPRRSGSSGSSPRHDQRLLVKAQIPRKDAVTNNDQWHGGNVVDDLQVTLGAGRSTIRLQTVGDKRWIKGSGGQNERAVS
jgi:hypothetical protein